MIFFFVLQAFYSTAIALILAMLFGSLTPWIAIVSLVAGALEARRHARVLQDTFPMARFRTFGEGQSGFIALVLSIFVIYASCRHFIWLLYLDDHRLSTLSALNFGDLPLHLNFIRAFVNGISFPPANPILATDVLRYPFGPDLYNALWEALGVRAPLHLAAVGILCAIVSVFLLRCFGGWWAIGAFFLSGGLSGFEVLEGARLKDFLANVEWKNLFLSVFITQRGFLFALPVGIILLLAARKQATRELDRRSLTPLGLLWGFLPLFHLHTFFIVSVMMALAAGERGLAGIKSLFRSRFFYVALAPATLLIWHSTAGFSKAGVAHWQFGWMAPANQAMRFFIFNFGPWLILPVFIAIGLLVPSNGIAPERRRALWMEFAGYVLLLALFFNLMLAPWAWDNIKILIWPYLGLARLAFIVLDKQLGELARPVAAFAFLFSGFVTILWSLQTPSVRGVAIYSTAELARAEGALQGVSPNAVFASAPTHNHVLTYFGRLRAVGYHGHLWSHGYAFDKLGEQINAIYHGREDWLDIARGLGVTHIYWGPQEREAFGEGDRPWMRQLENISRVSDHRIYAIVPATGTRPLSDPKESL